jgi:hypothetical protein
MIPLIAVLEIECADYTPYTDVFHYFRLVVYEIELASRKAGAVARSGSAAN